MKLSVVIVNYNVCFFLEQCLQSVQAALSGMQAEVFVVDNNSVDGSVAMLKQKFPWVKLIVNEKNTGFSVANNQAMRVASGEYVLLLNPDTVVKEDTFIKAVRYLDDHADAGALGVKMIDGKGNFLPESKRGLPTPWVAFYKIFGFSSIFPRSRVFGKYHLSYLDENRINEVEVLPGAFMLIRKKVLDEVGLLDESFFMYGEDIDISYRITKAGYKNIYFPESSIIHYKGESTKKGSINYVYLFYNAMLLFARKHFTGRNSGSLQFLIQLAIFFRAFISVLKRFVKAVLLPAMDILCIYAGIYFLTNWWAIFWFNNPHYYSSEFYMPVLPAYVLVWILFLLFSGAYDPPFRIRAVLRGIVYGTVFIVLVYALLPNSYRFSRTIILFGAFYAFIIASVIRILVSFTGINQFRMQWAVKKRRVIIGSREECNRIRALLVQLDLNTGFTGFVSVDRASIPEFIGALDQITEIVRIHKINELIFCARDLSVSRIIDCMHQLSHTGCDFKIAPAETEVIIGSNSINSAGDLYVYSLNSVASPQNRRIKRTFDIVFSIIIIVLFPLWIWNLSKSRKIAGNSWNVLFNRKTWVGYSGVKLNNSAPVLKRGVIKISEAYSPVICTPEFIEKLDAAYARDYRLLNDIRIIWKAYKKIGSL